MAKSKTRNIGKRKLLLAAAVVVALAGGYLWAQRDNDTPVTPQTKTPTVTAPTGIDGRPATEQEKQAAQDAKDRIVQDRQASESASASNKKQVNVVITHAGTDSVNAYVTGVFEEGGTCKATFTQGSTTITRTSSGFENVSYTQCAPISPNLPNANGWTVVVSYSSAAAEGKSQSQTF